MLQVDRIARGLLQRRVGNKRIETGGSVSDRGYCGKLASHFVVRAVFSKYILYLATEIFAACARSRAC